MPSAAAELLLMTLLLKMTAAACRASAAPSSVANAQQWHEVSVNLTSSWAYDNPYTDVRLTVTFTQTGGTDEHLPAAAIYPAGPRSAMGFWDGDSRWRWATFFSSPGTWQWSTRPLAPNGTAIDDAGLTQEGVVVVDHAAAAAREPAGGGGRHSRSMGKNPFLAKGPLRVSAETSAFLEFAGTGEPFFFLGDTVWAGPFKSDANDWEEYVQRRAAQGFTLVQVGVRQ